MKAENTEQPITRIDNDEDLQRALTRMWELWNAEDGPPEGAELDALADLIAPYEAALLAEDEATHKQQPDER